MHRQLQMGIRTLNTDNHYNHFVHVFAALSIFADTLLFSIDYNLIMLLYKLFKP